MGSIMSFLSWTKSVIFSHIHGPPLEQVPISYVRDGDYTICGTLRETSHKKWNNALHSMIFLELNTRRALWPLIRKRMDRIEASRKYTHCNLDFLKQNLKGWDDIKIFQTHDLFQAFEVDGDGLLEISEMSNGLDNLGDATPMRERIQHFTRDDEDGTGSIDFEEFVQILYRQQEIEHDNSPLSQTFRNVNNDIRIIRWMSSVQQIRAGFL